jgi:hypothetical protein
MIVDTASSTAAGLVPSRRQLLKSTPAFVAAAGAVSSPAFAQPVSRPDQPQTKPMLSTVSLQGNKIIGFMLAHEQFPVPELVQLGEDAAQAGFGALATSDHLQPWQANERHVGQAWVTLSSSGRGRDPHGSGRP